MKIYCLLFIIFIAFSGVSCQDKKVAILFQKEGYVFPYDLNNPAKLELSKELDEISGLSFYKKNKLFCIDDEKGDVFKLDFASGDRKKYPFGKDRDYEGIEMVGDNIWVVKSNGTLLRIKKYKSNDPSVKEYKSDLEMENDVEGLAYDVAENRLLLACKGYPFIDKKGGKKYKAIYSFDLEKKKLLEEPAFIIPLDDIKTFKKYRKFQLMGSEFFSELNPSKGDESFQPSGIAVHPKTGNIYIIASTGKLLVVLDRKGNYLYVQQLDPLLFRQPEGICFDEKANLFMSNEAKGLKANILKFSAIAVK